MEPHRATSSVGAGAVNRQLLLRTDVQHKNMYQNGTFLCSLVVLGTVPVCVKKKRRHRKNMLLHRVSQQPFEKSHRRKILLVLPARVEDDVKSTRFYKSFVVTASANLPYHFSLRTSDRAGTERQVGFGRPRI
jgi:hypothetical protein